MPNKIKDIFSDEMFNINGKMRFKDDEAYKNFLAALELVYAEGRTIPVNGVISITTEIQHQGAMFPFEEHANISHFVIGPAEEPIQIPLVVDTDKKTMILLRSIMKNKVILKSESNSIIFFYFTFLLDEKKHTVNYKVQFEKAKNIKEVADSFSLAIALFEKLYKHEKEKTTEDNCISLSDVKKYFRYYEGFFKRLHEIEVKLGLTISPSLLNNLSQEEKRDIDELYVLFCQKRIVRLNAKLTAPNSASISINNQGYSIGIGSELALTFFNTIEFNFLEQKVMLYTANLIINAIVKDVKKNDDGTLMIMYGDTDSAPMYIAFSAFRTEEEAKQEADNLLQCKESYAKALIIDEYIDMLIDRS